MGVIYKITNPNGRQYVGKTYNLRKRINAHKCVLKKKTGIILTNSIRKYGWDAHKLEVIEEVADELMDEREMFWISELKTYCYDYPGQMNMTKGGEGQRTTWKHNKERVKKQSERLKGSGNSFYGKKHSKEFKEWMSLYSKERNIKNSTIVPEWGAEKGRMKVRKPVLCYNKCGDFLSEYISLTQAAEKLNIAIESVKDSLKHDVWVRGKYFFRYKKDEVKLRIKVPPVTEKTVKRPVYWLSDNLEPICEFPSAQEASDFFNIPKTTINRAALYNDLNPIRTGHVFLYKDMYLKAYKIAS